MPKPHNPIRIFEGSHDPYEPFWRILDADQSESGEAEIEFYGYISEYSWFEDDITPKKFKEGLYSSGKGGPVTVRMNSGGGEVFAASVIKSIMVEYPGRVTVRIDGLAASAATVVAMGGDVIKIQDSAYFMIHDPSIVTWGTIEEIKKALDLLKTVKAGIVDSYVNRTKLAPEKLINMMTNETWMTAQEALDFGFVDEVIKNSNKSNLQPAAITALSQYRNVPPAVMEAFERMQQSANTIVGQPPAPVASALTDEQEREAQTLSEQVSLLLRKEKPNA